MKIIRYGGWEDIDVQFQDEFYYIKEHQTYSNFKKGEIKNPYDRTVFGVGYVGVGEYKTKKKWSFYNALSTVEKYAFKMLCKSRTPSCI